MTNADRIRSMSDEELAEWLTSWEEYYLVNFIYNIGDCAEKNCSECVNEHP